MPKSRGRKRKPNSRQPPTSLPPPRQLQGPKAILADGLRAILNHPIVALIGLIGTVGGIGELVHQALLDPEFSAEKDLGISSPFSPPFGVKNNSWLFSMIDADLECHIEKVRFKAGGTVLNFRLISGMNATIAPKGKGAFRCMLAGNPGQPAFFGPANEVVSAHIFLRLEYKTLWFERTSSEVEFTWYTGVNPPRWVEGKIVE